MKKISYSAVILDDKSRSKLITTINEHIPNDWEVIAHHQTINMGEINTEFERYLGMKVPLRATELGFSDKVMAIKTEGFPTVNKIPHITIAVNRKDGGKPFMSNQITNWKKIPEITLMGTVEEVPFR